MTRGRLLGLWAVLTVAAVVAVLALSEQAALDDPVQKGVRGEVSGLTGLSLWRPERMSEVLAALERRYPAGEVLNLKVTPTEVTTQLRSGRYRTASATVGLDLAVLETSTGETVQKGVRIGDVPPAAPARIIGRVNARTRTRPADVGDLSLSGGRPDPEWTLTLLRGTRPDRRTFYGSLSGESVRGAWEPTPIRPPS